MNRDDVLALTFAVLIGLGFGMAGSAVAVDVTADRLSNPDKEPQNWLMNHRSHDAQRYSPLDKINKTNVKSLRLAYAVAIGGTSANENLEATPLAEDGYLYVVDQWAWSTGSTGVQATWAGSSGAWPQSRRDCWQQTAVLRCGEIS
jgi:alcohol dehydrogenase (cytochrome c)